MPSGNFESKRGRIAAARRQSKLTRKAKPISGKKEEAKRAKGFGKQA
jgi:hypothetical protein